MRCPLPSVFSGGRTIMPRFKVTETRAFTNVFLIDADTEDNAEKMDGEIIEEAPDADSYTQSVDRVEEVGDNDTL